LAVKSDKLAQPFGNPALAHLTLACGFDSRVLLAPKVHLIPPYDHLTTKNQWRSVAASEYVVAFR